MKLFSIICLIIFEFTFANPVFGSGKRVEIDLTTQHLYAFEGENRVYETVISSGKSWWPTPTGTFKPWVKVKSQRMIGGNRSLGTFYNLPNVPNVIYFYRDYAIHGAYWHNNFGYPMSHGCVNVPLGQAKLLYDFIEMDTPIIISGQTPL